ncbi:MAG: hypothetical protein ACRD82_00765 [Blastocatellia bacterium]
MKIAILSESPADATAIHLLVESLLNTRVQDVRFRPETRSWPQVRDNLPKVLQHLHYRTDAEALVVVADLDDDPIHQPAHDTSGNSDLSCRLCCLRDVIRQAQHQLSSNISRPAIKTAVGVAVPAIESWLLCGQDGRASEAAWLQGGSAFRGRSFRLELKSAVYGNDRSSLSLKIQRASEEAKRLAGDLSLLENHFPAGFGALAQDLRNW